MSRDSRAALSARLLEAREVSRGRLVPSAASQETVLYDKGAASASGFRPSQWSYAADRPPEQPAPTAITVSRAARPAPMAPPPAGRRRGAARVLGVVSLLVLAGLGAAGFVALSAELRPAEAPRATADAPVVTVAASVTSTLVESAQAPAAQTTVVSEPPASDRAPLPRDLLARGDALLATGDIVAARGFYERAAELGSSAAATAIGKTYDPLFFEEAGVKGIRSDAVRAAQWYRRASRAGDEEAGVRLKLLTARYGA